MYRDGTSRGSSLYFDLCYINKLDQRVVNVVVAAVDFIGVEIKSVQFPIPGDFLIICLTVSLSFLYGVKQLFHIPSLLKKSGNGF